MEELKKEENFESFKNKITEIFEKEGLSESLSSEIEEWYKKRHQETDVPGSTAEDKITFQVEMARIYHATNRLNEALSFLGDAWTFADGMGLSDLAEEIKSMAREWNG